MLLHDRPYGRDTPRISIDQNHRIDRLSPTQARIVNPSSTLRIAKLAAHLDGRNGRTSRATTRDRVANIVFRAGGYASCRVGRIEAVEVDEDWVAVGGTGWIVGVADKEELVWDGADSGVGAGGVVCDQGAAVVGGIGGAWRAYLRGGAAYGG